MTQLKITAQLQLPLSKEGTIGFGRFFVLDEASRVCADRHLRWGATWGYSQVVGEIHSALRELREGARVYDLLDKQHMI